MITSKTLILVALCLMLGFAVGVNAQTLCAVSYTCSPQSSQGVNTNIVITATATGGDNVQYLFETGTGAGPVWTTLQDYSSTKTCPWKPTVPGTYYLRVQAREGSSGPATVMASATYIVTPDPPTGVTLNASPASPQPVNTTATLTAIPTGGTAPQFRFEVGTTLLQDWSSDATYDWTPKVAGFYALKVSVRETGLPSFVVTRTINYSATPVLSAAALAVSPVAPQSINKTIMLTGSTTGGANVQFKFEVGTGNPVTWVTKQAYSINRAYAWSPTTANTYSLRMTAREGANDATAIISSAINYLITPVPPTAVSLEAGPVSPQSVNTPITITASTAGGTAPQYKFQVGSSTLQDWSTTATYNWTPASAGTYVLQVSARETGLPSAVVSRTLSYVITPALSAASVGETPVGPQSTGKPITLSGSTTGGANIQYKFEIGSGNPVVWVTKQAYSAAKTYVWTPASPAAYSLRVTAREGTVDGTAKTSSVAGYLITATPPTSVTLNANLVSPQPVNATISLNAAVIGGTSPEFKFEANTTVLQDWSSGPTCNWRPATAGPFTLKVSAREAGLTTVVVTRTLNYTIAAALSAAALAESPVAPQPTGKMIDLVGSTVGGANVQYRFDVGTGNPVVWVTKQAYSATKSCAWTPIAPDSYSLRILAREGTDDSTAKTSAVTSYLVTPTPPIAVTLTAGPVSPQPANTRITLTAAATGGTAPQYKFEVGITTLQDWSSDATCDWTPASPGSYTLKISARETGLPAIVVTKSVGYTVTAVLSAAAFSVSAPSPEPVGKMITLTGSTTGGANVQYRFDIGSGNPVVWVTKQAYSSLSTFVWTPATPDTYSLRVSAREGTDDSTAKTSAVTSYLVTPAPPSSVSLVASPVSPQTVNTAITLTAVAVGGTVPEYKFEAGTALLQDWNASSAYNWTPATFGIYTVKVSCRETGLPTVVVSRSISYIVKGTLSAAQLVVSPAAPQTIGKAITLTGSTTGGANVQYKFDVGTGNPMTWVTKQAYSSAIICGWTPVTPDNYSLRVTAREAGDDSTAKASAITTYLITPTPPTAVTLVPSPVSPQPANTSITLTAAATGGTVPEFKFELGGTVLRDWGQAATYDWTPTTAGSYTLKVSARETGLPATLVTRALTFVVLAPVGLSGVTITASPDAPQAVNTEVTLTAHPIGGVNVQYKFEVGADSAGVVSYNTQQTWGSGRMHTWVPSSANHYYVRVSAREGAAGNPVTSSTAYIVPGDMVVTAPFDGFFYVQNVTGPNVWGIRVVNSDTVALGDLIRPIVGTLGITAGGESYINSTSIGRNGMSATPAAVNVLLPQTIATAPGGKIGVLVVTHGRVVSIFENTMVVDDGRGGASLTVIGPNGGALVGSLVDVTGICSLDAQGLGVLLTRSGDDVVVR